MQATEGDATMGTEQRIGSSAIRLRIALVTLCFLAVGCLPKVSNLDAVGTISRVEWAEGHTVCVDTSNGKGSPEEIAAGREALSSDLQTLGFRVVGDCRQAQVAFEVSHAMLFQFRAKLRRIGHDEPPFEVIDVSTPGLCQMSTVGSNCGARLVSLVLARSVEARHGFETLAASAPGPSDASASPRAGSASQ
jgi:hypothetical protein